MSPARPSRPDPAPRTLAALPAGGRATVTGVVAASAEIDAVALRRLGELGFLPGEPVQLLRRGPGGREPLAVLIGETMFALRLIEAQCVEIEFATEGDGRGRPGAGPLPSPAAPQGPRRGPLGPLGAATEGSVGAP